MLIAHIFKVRICIVSDRRNNYRNNIMHMTCLKLVSLSVNGQCMIKTVTITIGFNVVPSSAIKENKLRPMVRPRP